MPVNELLALVQVHICHIIYGSQCTCRWSMHYWFYNQ